MTWFKVDDKFHSHRKVAALGADVAALSLWVVAGSWSADQPHRYSSSRQGEPAASADGWRRPRGRSPQPRGVADAVSATAHAGRLVLGWRSGT